MGKLVRGILVVAAAMALAAVWSAPAVAQQPSCPTAPAYDSRVPTPESVLRRTIPSASAISGNSGDSTAEPTMARSTSVSARPGVSMP